MNSLDEFMNQCFDLTGSFADLEDEVTLCPHCGGEMDEVFVRIGDDGIWVNSCPDCGAHLPVG